MSKWYGIRATDVGTLSQSITQSWDEVQALAHDHKSSRARHRMHRKFVLSLPKQKHVPTACRRRS